MTQKRANRSRQRMRSGPLTRPDAKPFDIQGRHLLCAVCVRGGCKAHLPGHSRIIRLLQAMWQYPFVTLRILADLDVNRAHYLDVYAGRGQRPLPQNFIARQKDYVGRRKDLEVCRRLGIMPGSALPAFLVYRLLFERAPTLDGICRTASTPSRVWPECPQASKGYYEKIAGHKWEGLALQTKLGEKLDGIGLWAMVRPRTRADMKAAKAASAKRIVKKADRLFIRPSHALCLICTATIPDPLPHDNLVELRQRIETDPNIPVTLTEGCCMVCDPCNVYHPGEHLCYKAHADNQLRDLMVLERLGLPPGATLSARELYTRIYKCIPSLRDICAWGDGSNTAPFWAPCGGANKGPRLEQARAKGLFVRGGPGGTQR